MLRVVAAIVAMATWLVICVSIGNRRGHLFILLLSVRMTFSVWRLLQEQQLKLTITRECPSVML